jgi:phenylpropionate dioxygenase-like ring-hydroxylating dioxygenase large terminal subunit
LHDIIMKLCIALVIATENERVPEYLRSQQHNSVMSFLKRWAIGGTEQAVEAPKSAEPIRALPASWYTSENMYQLERRAIFGRRWMMITHKSRLENPGTQLDFDVADYSFTIERTVDGFAGQLASGQKIHVRVDASGFVWVNLDSRAEVPWEADFAGIDVQERYKVYNFDDYVLDHEYRNTGPYNWKILADNFNECYHCPTAHPTIDSLADIETHDVKADHGWIKHQSTPTEEQQQLGMAIASTYFFPNVSISVL